MTEIDKINSLLEKNTITFCEDDMESIAYDIAGDFDWYYGENEAEVAIATHVDDYQIITNHVMDMVSMVRWKDLDGVEHDTEEGEYNDYYTSLSQEQQEKYDNGWTELYDYYTKSTDEGAYKQYWLNVKTGACFVRDRLLNHPKHGIINNVGGEWTPLKQIEPGEATDEAYYKVDFSIHPLLEERGYECFSAQEYNDATDPTNDHIIENRVQFFDDMRTNPQLCSVIRYGGLEMLGLVSGEHRQQYITAVKIANRHHYMPDDKRMWMDYLHDLIELDKDLHNPFYVCPEDLREAHDKFHRIYVREKEKIEKERRLQELIARSKPYADRINPFLQLAWITDQYAVFVCPSVADMVEEGQKMHHCVGSMGYDKKPDSLILFCRTPNGDRISTIEYSISRGKVLQNRAACNKVPLYLDEVNKMLEKDADRIRACKLVNINKSKVQPVATAIAVAA